LDVYYVSLKVGDTITAKSVVVVVLDRKPTAKTRETTVYSCCFTHLVAHALDLGAIEGAFGVRAAHLEVVLTRRIELRDVGVGRRRLDGRRAAAIVRRGDRGCLEAGRVGGLFRPPRRGRRGERGKRRRERRSLLSRRRVVSRERRADRGGERRGRGLEPAVDVREVRGGRAREQEYRRVSRRSRRRRPSGGGRPRGGGRVEQSRGPPSESKRQAREHATAGEGGRGRRGRSRRALLSRGCVSLGVGSCACAERAWKVPVTKTLVVARS
jgi:hypothetical protein